MTVDNGVRIVVGSMLLLSLALTQWVHPGFFWLSVFVGVNLIQSAFSGFCPAAMVLRRLGCR
ncbi:YgaP family membrane protein [Aeromonas salmonicida]|uniref:YgaP family membrane protein n=1 Tax=Aeromonas salmonicida TaxID=645 RepID=UPI003D22B786